MLSKVLQICPKDVLLRFPYYGKILCFHIT